MFLDSNFMFLLGPFTLRASGGPHSGILEGSDLLRSKSSEAETVIWKRVIYAAINIHPCLKWAFWWAMVPHHADPEDGHPSVGQAFPDKYLPWGMSWETRDVERGYKI